ncbi:MAG: protein-disulfide reductase DsbD N-terminal domain-containing protein [Gemmatimonadaceae bacterium]|nr:protein-disulfide reductase DsbD N-terminal domain-containing protein [Gemmatimonadaceae bacterium]
MTFRRLLAIALLSLACTGPDAAPKASQSVARFSVAENATSLASKPGGTFELHVTAAIDSGWHVYSLTQKSGGPVPLSISVAPTEVFTLDGAPKGPQPTVKVDPTFGMDTETYDGTPLFIVPVRIGTSAPSGVHTLDVTVRSQTCSDWLCLDPKTTRLTVPVTVAAR